MRILRTDWNISAFFEFEPFSTGAIVQIAPGHVNASA
jgi:hypothetical protein